MEKILGTKLPRIKKTAAGNWARRGGVGVEDVVLATKMYKVDIV
jgi:hypothetical protein